MVISDFYCHKITTNKIPWYKINFAVMEIRKYRYNINYSDDMTVHDLYIKHSNQNVSALNFAADIEDIMIAASVDMPLT